MIVASETRFGEILPLWQDILSLQEKLIESLFNIWQKIEPLLEEGDNWANLYCSKWPIVE